MSTSFWMDPHGLRRCPADCGHQPHDPSCSQDDDPCPCESDPYQDRKPCPTHLTRCCAGCQERFPESELGDLTRGREEWSWCPTCAADDVFDFVEADREPLAAIGVWLPQNLRTPSTETWAIARGLRTSLERDLELFGYLTWSGAEVTLWAGRGQRLATVSEGLISWGGAMQRAVIRRAA